MIQVVIPSIIIKLQTKIQRRNRKESGKYCFHCLFHGHLKDHCFTIAVTREHGRTALFSVNEMKVIDTFFKKSGAYKLEMHQDHFKYEFVM